MEQENNQAAQAQSVLSRANKWWIKIGLMLLSVFVLIVILTYFNIIQVFPFLPHGDIHIVTRNGITSVVKTQTVPKEAIETCAVRAKDFSLVYNISGSGPIITGQYRGTVETLNSIGSAISVTIFSDDQEEKHTFLLDGGLPFYDAVHAKKIQKSEIKTGDYLGVNFNCDASRGEHFEIISAGIEKKST